MATKQRVIVCHYCGEPTTMQISWRAKKRIKPPQLHRNICMAQPCWDKYYKELDAL